MVSGWIEKYGLVLAFYILIILLIYVNRKKFEFQGKIIAIYKTKLGLALMDKMGKKFIKLMRLTFSVLLFFTVGAILFSMDKFLGLISQGTTLTSVLLFFGILVWLIVDVLVVVKPKYSLHVITGIGFAGMLLMIFFIFLGTYNLVFVPEAPPMFSPVLPGVSIPGSPVTLPLFEGLIALFIVVIIHEFMHGVISRACKIPVTSSGFVMFGPIPGAFVEPDEKKLKKSKRKVQLAIFAGGPFANIILAFVVVILITGFTAISTSMYSASGIEVKGFTNVSDAVEGGRLENISEGEVIFAINDVEVNNIFNLSEALGNVTPGQVVVLHTDKGYKQVTLGSNPENESLPYLGVFLNHHVEGNNKVADNKIFSAVYFWFFGNPYDLRFNQGLGMIGWIFIISLGIGIVNLLPLGPMDGGRMYILMLEKYMDKKKAHRVWAITSMVLVFLLVLLIFVPIIKAVV